MKMPVGKYKGKPVSSLSAGYCRTLLFHVPIKDEALKEALEAQALTGPKRSSRRSSFVDSNDIGWEMPEPF